MQFYGHIYRMDESRLTKRIFNLLNGYKSKPTWFTATQGDMESIGIGADTIANRTIFRELIQKLKFPENKKLKNGRKWTQEQKECHSQRMKEIWAKRKLGLQKHIQK